MIKMEIRASTIIFAKNKAKQRWNEEKDLLLRLNLLQEKLRSNFSKEMKVEMDQVKKELAKIVSKKTRGAMTHSKHNGTSSVKRTISISTIWKK